MKIGIYTIHADTNYGAMLQAFATQAFLRQNNIDAEIVNVFTKDALKRLQFKLPWNSIKNIAKNILAICHPLVRKKIQCLFEFHHSMALSKKYESIDDLYKTPPCYDIHLVGSDQVWNLQNGFKERNIYFLDFLKNNEIKMSYASSMGNPNIAETLYPRLKELLSTFKAISTREKDAAILLSKVTGGDVDYVLDPTFLLSSDEWMQQTCKEPIVKGSYILYYGFDKSERCREMIDELKHQLKMPVVAVSVSLTIPYQVDTFCRDAGPREFLNLIRFSSYVITSSFHGMALAINFRRNFFVMSHGDRMSRMESLLSDFNLQHRIVQSKDELRTIYNEQPNIDYSGIENALKSQIVKSQQWLLTNLRHTTQYSNS